MPNEFASKYIITIILYWKCADTGDDVDHRKTGGKPKFRLGQRRQKEEKNSLSAPCVGFEKQTPEFQFNPMGNHFHSYTLFLPIATVTPFTMLEAQ